MNTEFFWTFAGYCCMKSGDHCDMNTDSRADSQQVQNSVDGDGGRGGLMVTGVIWKDRQQPLDS